MRILVTGGSGFLGRHTVPHLAQGGAEVFVVGRSPRRPESLEYNESSLVRHVTANLLQDTETSQLLRDIRPTHLLHLAWYVEHGAFWESPNNLDWLASSLMMARRFQEHGGERFVGVGSCAEYDWSHGYCVEDLTPLAPRSLYGQCKHALQTSLRRFFAEDVRFAWGRLFFLLGPEEGPHRLVPSVTRRLLAGERAECSSGNQIRDFLDVRDAGAALAAILLGEFEGCLNICSGNPIRIRQLVTQLADLVGTPQLPAFGVLPDRKHEPPLIVGDPTRLLTTVGYSPSHSIESSLEASIAFWREQTRGA